MEERFFITAAPYPFKTSQEITWRQRWFNGMTAVIQIKTSLKVATCSSGSFLTAAQLHCSQRTPLPANRLSVRQPRAPQLKPLSSRRRCPRPPEHADQPSEAGEEPAWLMSSCSRTGSYLHLMGQVGGWAALSSWHLRLTTEDHHDLPWLDTDEDIATPSH